MIIDDEYYLECFDVSYSPDSAFSNYQGTFNYILYLNNVVHVFNCLEIELKFIKGISESHLMHTPDARNIVNHNNISISFFL